MPYKYYQEWGIVDPSADIAEWVSLFIGLVLAVLLCLISWKLLQTGRFRGHLVFLALMLVWAMAENVLTMLPAALQGNDILLLLFAWDHYWTRHQRGEAACSPEKARRIQVGLAALVGVCWLLCRLQVGFFGHFNESSLLVMAGYLLAHAYYHRKDSDGPLDSWFL